MDYLRKILNILLQILLIFIDVSKATLLAQLIGMIIGFFVYGKFVFKNKELSLVKLIKYSFTTLFIWIVNWNGILLFISLGFNKNIAALLLIPFLASLSYFIQKKRVFI